MRGWLLIVCGCGARTELTVPPDAAAPVVDASHDVASAVDVVTAPDVATQSEPTVVVTSDAPIYAMAMDQEHIYWTQGYWPMAQAPQSATAMQCDKANCSAPIVLGAGVEIPLSIAVDDTSVYWTAGSPQWGSASAVLGLFRCAIGGCTQNPEALVAAPAHGVETGAGRLFWIGPTGVSECAAGNCAAASAAIATGAGTVKVDGAYAYWSTETSIMRCALASGVCASPPVVIVPDAPANTLGASFIPNFRTFAMDGENIYWLSHGEVRRCPKEGCATPITIMPADNTQAQCIATDGVNVYWTAPLAIVRCPVTGCDKPIRVYMSLPEDLPEPNCVALDDDDVYWSTGSVTGTATSSGSIMRSPKP